MYGNLSIWIDSLNDGILATMLVSAIVLLILGGWLTQKHKAFITLSVIGVILFTGIIIRVADGTYQSLKVHGVFESAVIPIIPIIAFVIGLFLIAGSIKYKEANNSKSPKTEK